MGNKGNLAALMDVSLMNEPPFQILQWYIARDKDVTPVHPVCQMLNNGSGPLLISALLDEQRARRAQDGQVN